LEDQHERIFGVSASEDPWRISLRGSSEDKLERILRGSLLKSARKDPLRYQPLRIFSRINQQESFFSEKQKDL
jgi:hypothetical protein